MAFHARSRTEVNVSTGVAETAGMDEEQLRSLTELLLDEPSALWPGFGAYLARVHLEGGGPGAAGHADSPAARRSNTAHVPIALRIANSPI
jgi:hypothetical protein